MPKTAQIRTAGSSAGMSACPRGRRGAALAAACVLLAAFAAPTSAGAGEAPVALVVLAPRVISGGEADTTAAQNACDALARELARDSALRVVDRTQLDRILAERGLAAAQPRPLLSYDIMVRLEVDAVRPTPKVRLMLVDLSDGNLLADVEFAWAAPLPGSAIGNLAETCRSAARKLTRPEDKALRVRLLEVGNPGNSARLEPLAARLRDAVAGALDRSEGIRLVHHLEALTAKEESLLLTLGLSRLAGARQFTPQSDATIELRIRELDGVGKTFEQTRVEVAWRINKAGPDESEWASAEAAVADFDKLVKDAWARIAAEIGKAAPSAGSDFLNELALRRRQAQAELDAAPKGFDLTREQAIKRLEHVAAAVKIDPTFEEAAYQLVYARLYDRSISCYGAAIREAWRYLQRFKSDGEHRGTIASQACFWCRSFNTLRELHPDEKMDAETREAFDALKQIVDTFADAPFGLLPGAMRIAYRGMAEMGVPKAERRQWMQQVISRGEKNAAAPASLPEARDEQVLNRKIYFRVYAAGLLLAENDTGNARKYLEELVPLLAASNKKKGDLEEFFRQVETLNDPAMLARLNAAAAETVWPLGINWLNMNVLGMMPPTGPRPRANVTALSFTKYQGASPLAACGKRMYCTVPAEKSGDTPHAAYVDLDSAGRPAGKITLLPEQPPVWPKDIVTTAVAGDRLYIGTKGQGLLEYDTQGGKWRTFGPEKGLPAWNVHTLLALGDGALFCHVGGTHGKQGFFCRIDPRTSEITLLRRLAHEAGRNPLVDSSIRPVWKTNDSIVGFIGGGAIYTLPKLGAGEPVRQSWPTPKSNGYYEAYQDGMAVVAGRRLLKCRDALREIDDEGKVLRSWPRPRTVQFTSGPKDLPGHDVLLATDQPDLIDAQNYRCVAQDDSHIFFLDSWTLCYEPATETWYGPMETEPWTACSSDTRAVGGPGGIWFQDDRSLIYLDTADFIAAARKSGRVVTAEDFKKKRAAAIEALAPLDQAKWALSMKKYDRARDLAAAALAAAPKEDRACAEALLILGLLHEPCCLNQPDKALEYYARLAAMDSDPCAALAGLAHQYRMLLAASRAKEALQVGRDIERRYPRNSFRDALARYNRQLGKQIEGKSK